MKLPTEENINIISQGNLPEIKEQSKTYIKEGKFYLAANDKLLDDIPMYGYGKPVACGGHIKFKDGLITKITNGSGHYMPNSDQLKLVCKHFKDLGVLSKDVVIEAYSHGVNSCIKIDNSDFLDSVVVGDILEQYPEL